MYNKKLNNSLLVAAVTTFLLSGCNSGTNNSSSALNNISPVLKAQKLNAVELADMDTLMTVDEGVTEKLLSAALKDMGWHVLTIKVTRMGKGTSPTPVDGMLSIVYPKPSPNVGQAVETQDINCQSAVFSKDGDSCSIYFRLYYDMSKGTTNTVKFPVQFTPKGNVPGLMQFTAPVNPAASIADYRFAIPTETKYYSAPSVAANKMRYQILVAQNGSLSPIAMMTLPQPTNPLFKIIHRTTNDASDPYYGTNAECSTTSNPALNQISNLDKLFANCIVIYQAATTSTVPEATEALQIASNASYFFPTWGDKFQLKADYTNANPEQSQTIYGSQMSVTSGAAHPSGSAMVMDSAGSLEYTAPTKSLVNAVTIDDFVRAAPAQGAQYAINQSSGTLYYDPYAGQAPLPVNKPLLVTTNASSLTQTTVTNIGEVTPDNQVYYANIEGGCPIHASVRMNKGDLKWGGHLPATVYYAYNGLAQTFDNYFNPYGSGELVHLENRSSTWTNVLIGSYGQWSCKSLLPTNPDICLTFSSTGRFYNLGEPNPRTCDQSVNLRVPTPDYRNYEVLSTPVEQPIAYVGNGGQSYQATIGNTAPIWYTPSYQVNGAASNGVLLASYRLTAAPAQQVKYIVYLNAGDIFYQTNLNFARSEGYDLIDFSEETICLGNIGHE